MCMTHTYVVPKLLEIMKNIRAHVIKTNKTQEKLFY